MKRHPVTLLLELLLVGCIWLLSAAILDEFWLGSAVGIVVGMGCVWVLNLSQHHGGHRGGRIGYCENCQYELRGLEADKGHRCPECGEAIGWSQKTIELYHQVKDEQEGGRK